MSEGPMKLIFRGVRGSTRVPDAASAGAGGHSSCLEVVLSREHRLILDAGSGLRALQAGLPAIQDLRFDVLLSHYHWDHIEGLPFFDPLYSADCEFTFYGAAWEGKGVEEILSQALRPPFFPVPLEHMASRKRFVQLDGAPFTVGPVEISTARLSHPQGVTAFRLEHAGGALVYATDHEPGLPGGDAALLALAAGAGALILDAQYLPEEYAQRRGRGHGTWRQAVDLARSAGVERLYLFHHDPGRTDAQIEAVVAAARELFPAVDAAREGAVVEF